MAAVACFKVQEASLYSQ